MIYVVLIYMTIALLQGLMISLTNERFKRLSMLKQLILLFISPILLIRELVRGKDDRNLK